MDNLDLHVMDAEKPGFGAASFDVITGSFSIIFLPDATTALGRFRRLLAPGGKLGFTAPVSASIRFPSAAPIHQHHYR